ncbi:bifunctional adenosylcobinamide kinase/adenosylcobinamide-phosphate guanylyltransferase [Filibacter tadaridae]|uniref:Adenosylcobinamide kinase n=1 Tax=Filibacter tadaridae TaxID=2483811 RepID=A0A3P5W7P4_9BACL|nr:bifunctional adenosylcobinamide kinase/adenosylcobinamide-phosphate guanylyltransferase [Filibacter tadaridae]VDC19382.1 Bifunctional adenosylcobalamin biosynthesis protein CobP [Filibacter tadaridae]
MVRGKLTVIIGGVRSGKSAYAEKMLVDEASHVAGRLVYIASGTATDAEMQARIDRHKQDRAEIDCTTIEQPVELAGVVPSIQQGDLVLWDCLTTWLANELYSGWETATPCISEPGCMEQKEAQLYETINDILAKTSHLVIVSNEVLDELPSTYMETRTYSKWIGRIHQKLVAQADEAIEIDYGLATDWKNGQREVLA